MDADEPAAALKVCNPVKRNSIVSLFIAKVEISVPFPDFGTGFAEDGAEFLFLYRLGKEAERVCAE